jgi:hypothetical protein
MNKHQLFESIARAFNVEPVTRAVADSLGLTVPTVAQWPETGDISRGVLRGVVGDFVRRGVKVPADIVKAIKESK